MRVAWIWVAFGLFWQGYAQSGINYAASFGGCEIGTHADGIADGWSVWRSFGGSTPHSELGLHFQLTRARAVEGQRSQEIRISRSSGEQGVFSFSASVISPNWEPNLSPPVGTPLLVRMWVQTEDLNNLTVRAFAVSGQQNRVLSTLPANSTGWIPISAVVPLEANAEGRPAFRVGVEVAIGAGAASGRIWVDGVEVIWTGFNRAGRARPNMLKILHYNCPVNHWQMLLDPAVDFLIAPLAHIQALSAYLPNTESGIYTIPACTFDVLPPPWEEIYGGYHYVLQHRPHWLLRRQGNPFNSTAYPYLWYVDPGHPEVQEQFVNWLVRTREQLPLPRWIFLDSVGWQPDSDQYPDFTRSVQVWTNYFNYVIPTAHQRTNRAHRFIANFGSWAGLFVDGNLGEQWIQHIDGVMLEHALAFYRGRTGEYIPQPYRHNRQTLHLTDSTWWGTLRAINAHPQKVWVIVAMCDANENPALFRYILASYFIIAHSNTYLMVEDRRTAGPGTYHKWLRRPEPWVPLGNPTGSWYILAGTTADHTGALFARNFEHGIVLVNPTDPNPNDPSQNRVYEYVLPRAYKNWDGQVLPAGTRLRIEPKTGVVLYAAPEIRMTISPQQVTALPGEVVTFTVQYRNDGLADGANIRISVPLPEGLEFVSCSTGGQFLNRQITWTLPQVRAGQSGTLTFQARVQ